MNKKKYFQGVLVGGAVLLLCGCRSTPAPEPLPQAVQQVELLELTAVSVTEAKNWEAAAHTWKEVAQKYALLDRRARQAIALHNQAYADFQRGSYDLAQTEAEEAAGINQEGNEWWKNQILLLQIERKLDPQTLSKRMNDLLALAGEQGLKEKEPLLWGLLVNEEGVSLMRQGQAESALALFTQVLELGETLEKHLALAVRANQAECNELLNQYEKALLAWGEILEESKLIPDEPLIAAALAGEGRSHWKMGDLDQGALYLRRAAQNYQWLQMNAEHQETQQSLSECLKEKESSAQ